MPNRTGKNTPSSFEGFTEGTPYGERKQQAALQRSAPVAGHEQAGHMLGTPHHATELAIRHATKTRPQPAPTPVPQAAEVPSPVQVVQTDSTPAVWQAVASQPGASELVKWYAAQAASQPAT